MKKRTGLIWRLPVLLMSVFFSAHWQTAQASDELQLLPIATSEFAPFEYTQDEKVIGSDSEIVERALEKVGYKAEFRMMPWARALQYAKSGKVAGVFSLTKSQERTRFLYFSEPINYVKDVFFKLKYRNIQWQTFSDLAAYRVGVGHGYVYAPEFMQAFENKVFRSVNPLTGNNLEFRQLKQLKNSQNDLMICEISVCNFLLYNHPSELRGIDYIDRPIGEIRPYFIGFSKKWVGSERIVKRFNQALQVLKDTGEHEAILKRYRISTRKPQ